MTSEKALNFLVEEGIRWVETQRDASRSTARDLTQAEKSALAPFFEQDILDSAKVKFLPAIKNPGFYDTLQDTNIPMLLDFSTAAGVTFKDTIAVSQRYFMRESLTSLLFHELVHVVQCKVLGIRGFIEKYVFDWFENGLDYYAVPLEVDAFKLQRRYDENPEKGFSVESEVLRRIGMKA